MPLKCPVPHCSSDPFKDLDALAKHVFQLARWYPLKRSGEGVGMRQIHYEWLKQKNVTLKYETIRRYLENLLSQDQSKKKLVIDPFFLIPSQ